MRSLNKETLVACGHQGNKVCSRKAISHRGLALISRASHPTTPHPPLLTWKLWPEMTPALVEPRSFLVKTFVVGINMESWTYQGIFIVQLSHQNTKLAIRKELMQFWKMAIIIRMIITNSLIYAEDGDDCKDSEDVDEKEKTIFAQIYCKKGPKPVIMAKKWKQRIFAQIYC